MSGILEFSNEGAHVTRWAPEGFSDILWCSTIRLPGKPLRGGIPVCWPWFGPHPTNPTRPQHGYGRLAEWKPVSVGLGTCVLDLGSAEVAAFNPEHALKTSLTITQAHNALTLRLDTTNVGGRPAPLSVALHTYFAVSDVAAIEIEGLDGTTYRDNTRGGVATQHTGPMRIPGETIALFDEAPSRQTLIDPGFKRRIQIDRTGPGSTIVWNPGANASTMADIPAGEAARFVCIESGCIGSRALMLAPGASHSLDVTLRVEQIS